MSTSFLTSLSFLPSASAGALSSAKASESNRPTDPKSEHLQKFGQAPGQEFSQALARSLSGAQHNARREQAAAETKNTHTLRMNARRAEAAPTHSPKKSETEQASKHDKTRSAEGSDALGPDVSNAALGVLDWLGAQVGSKVLGMSSDSTPAPAATDPQPAMNAADTMTGTTAIKGDASGVTALRATGQFEADGLPVKAAPPAGSTSLEKGKTEAQTEIKSDIKSDIKRNEIVRADDPAALLKPDVPTAQNGSTTIATASSQDAQARAAVASDANRRVVPTRAAPRTATTNTAQAGMAPVLSANVSAGASAGLSAGLSAKAVASAFALSESSTNATASTSASAPAFKSASKDGSASADTSRTAFADAALANSALANSAMDTPAGVQAPSDSLSTPPGTASLGQHLGQIEAEVGSPAWHQALSQQVMQMRQGNASEAELQLNPAGLGPLRIKLSLREQDLNAEFTAAHAQVRAALEAALPQLREALQQGGLQLAQAWVESPKAQTPNESTGSGSGAAGREGQGQGQAAESGRGRQAGSSDRLGLSAQSGMSTAATAAGMSETTGRRHGPGQRLNTFA